MTIHSALPGLPEPFSGEKLCSRRVNGTSAQVREDTNWRWLLFVDNSIARKYNSTPVQSLLFKPDATRLVPEYMQLMCAGLALAGSPVNRALQLGLGGGAINRFLVEKFAIGELVTVELYAEIIDIYHSYFGGIKARGGDAIIQGSAENFPGQYSGEPFDYVFIDLFDHNGLPEYCYTTDFFVSLGNIVKDKGMIAINVPFREQHSLEQLFIALRGLFCCVSFCEIPEHANLVLFASRYEMVVNEQLSGRLDTLLDICVPECLANRVTAPSLSYY